MAYSETEPPPAPPSAKTRHRSGAFIAAFVSLQFLIPLTYLLRADPTDERFTWRTFTASAPPSCETSASLERFDGQREAISVSKLIQQDWVDYLSQDRRAVVDAFLQKQCESKGVLQVQLVNRCEGRSTHAYDLRCGSGRPHETARTAAR